MRDAILAAVAPAGAFEEETGFITSVRHEQLLRESDLVFVTSEALRQRALRHTDRVHLFPFAVSFAKFERAFA